MARVPDAFDMDEADERGEPQEVTCNRCGTEGLHWERVTSADGRAERPVLFNDSMRQHVCTPSADDFEVVR